MLYHVPLCCRMLPRQRARNLRFSFKWCPQIVYRNSSSVWRETSLWWQQQLQPGCMDRPKIRPCFSGIGLWAMIVFMGRLMGMKCYFSTSGSKLLFLVLICEHNVWEWVKFIGMLLSFYWVNSQLLLGQFWEQELLRTLLKKRGRRQMEWN